MERSLPQLILRTLLAESRRVNISNPKDQFPGVSVLIRSKNEEKWIWRLLESIKHQSLEPLEIILVDNESIDRTVEIAKEFGLTKILTINDYTPGRALNMGFKEAIGDLVAVISAHCIPETNDWLLNLTEKVLSEEKIAAVYGRQKPLPFSHEDDKADLLAVFRPESRIQKTDGFFNNANSLIKKSIWERIPFDESVNNLEDRVWGEKIIEAGSQIAYSAESGVFHYNGLHRTSSRRDQKSSVRVLEDKLPSETSVQLDSYRMIFEKSFVPLLISNAPSKEELENEKKSLQRVLSQREWDAPLVISELGVNDPSMLSRLDLGISPNAGLDELLLRVAMHLEKTNSRARYLGVFIPRMGTPSTKEAQALVSAIVMENADSSFMAERVLKHVWFQDDDGEYEVLDNSLAERSNRKNAFISSYGHGSIFSLQRILANQMFGGRNVIVVRDEEEFEKRSVL